MKNIYLFPVSDSNVVINLDLVVAIGGISINGLSSQFKIYGDGKEDTDPIISEQCLVKEHRKLINAWKKHHKDKAYFIRCSSDKSKSLYLLLDKIVSIGDTFQKDYYNIYLLKNRIYMSKGSSESFESFEKTKKNFIKTWKEKEKTFSRPLLRLDMGNIFGSYVGESEGNMRAVLDMCTSIAPSVLWLDKIEKSMAGNKGGKGHKSTKSKSTLNAVKDILNIHLFKPLKAPDILIDFEKLLYISEIQKWKKNLSYELYFVESSPKTITAYEISESKKDIEEFKANRTALIDSWIKYDGKLSETNKKLYRHYKSIIMSEKFQAIEKARKDR